eukprot:gnl/TRDRNA2_/TRDRNA2_130165_c0_seq4.p1 gnl/TRDRNA2_/TRDRNA2_130165_c0~~gnl/TRDRNA2_/TRDRNA2_130165_c0_seq4.p1  ORF type:complete len:176 (-),score=54.64 gnl/TRDRNA2_/TRDRNA2_130165_c0_seq4:45-572(-)
MQNITALGPQNPFSANLLSALGVMHFEDEDVKQVFDKLDVTKSGCIEKNQVFELLKRTYGFEPMPEEMGLFVSTLNLEEDGPLQWEELEAAMGKIREMLASVSDNAKEHCSYDEMMQDRYKHQRYKKDPMDKYKAPMTEAQAYGWHEEEVFNERFPKKSCAETLYADEFVKSGWD